MKTTKYEKLVRKITYFGRKNKFCRILMLILLVPIVGVHNMIFHLAHNGRRLTVIACAGVCFLVNASFRAYSVTPVNETEESDLATEAIARQELLKDSMVQVLREDEDFEIFDTEYVGFEDDELDIFTLDEILEGFSVDNDADEDGNGEVSDEDPDVQAGLSDILSENPDIVISDNNEPKKDASDYEDYPFSAEDWRYILVNKQHPIPEGYTFELSTIRGTLQCDSRILEDLIRMLQAAQKDGVYITVCSPYRDMDKQIKLFNRKINQYMNKGYSYLDSYKLASQLVTVPGTSEHQLGLSIDFLANNYRNLDYGFGRCAAGKWLYEHGYEYGFILRYPKGKENITGIDYEPWHYRYVGVEAATVIMQNGITLEEFTDDYLN